LIRRFGADWYQELTVVAKTYQEQNGKNSWGSALIQGDYPKLISYFFRRDFNQFFQWFKDNKHPQYQRVKPRIAWDFCRLMSPRPNNLNYLKSISYNIFEYFNFVNGEIESVENFVKKR
jgi:hypothetical protein